MLKKLFTVFITIILMIEVCSLSYASEMKTSLETIQKSSETNDTENDYIHISKKIVNCDSNNGEVEIELRLSEIKQPEAMIDTEVVLVIDNSQSMLSKSAGITRKSKVIDAARKLTEKLFATSPNIKVGMLRFHGGAKVENAAKVMSEITNNKDQVISAIDKLPNKTVTKGTNILAGLTSAKNMFSANCNNKIIILLTDGVPNYDLSGNNNPTADNKKQLVYTNTKQGLTDLSNSGIYLVSMMTGIADNANDADKKIVVEQIFGTHENPTAGAFYNISDSDIDKVVNEDIYSEITKKMKNSINSIKLVDYFPKEISKNFDITDITTIQGINALLNTGTENVKIEWDIQNNINFESALLKYKLKLKDMKNKDLLNKVISTNEKVELSYTDMVNKKYSCTLADSPKIKLVETVDTNTNIENVNNTSKNTVNFVSDNTNTAKNTVSISKNENTANKTSNTNATNLSTNTQQIKKDGTISKENTLPKTGINIKLIIAIVLVVANSVIAYKKYKNIK